MTAWLPSIGGWPWGPILTTILGSGVVSAIATGGLKAWGEANRRNEVAADTALKAAIALEDLARQLADVAGEWMGFDMQTRYERPWPGTPDGPDLQHLNWLHVGRGLAARTLGFPIRVSLSKAYVSGAFDQDDDFGAGLKIAQCLALAREAWEIAADLRKAHRLPGPNLKVDDWDFMAWVDEQRRRLAEEEQARRMAPDPLLI